jgi:hypothetical protein
LTRKKKFDIIRKTKGGIKMYITMTTPDEVYIDPLTIAKNILRGFDFDQALHRFLYGRYNVDLAGFIENSLTCAEKNKINEEVRKEIEYLKKNKNNKVYKITYSYPKIEIIFAPNESTAIDNFHETYPSGVIGNIEELERVEIIDE